MQMTYGLINFGLINSIPIKYFIRPMKAKYWFFFTKTYYIVESEYATLGNFDTIELAMEVLTLGKVSIKDITICSK